MSYLHVDATCSESLMKISFGGIFGDAYGPILVSLNGYHDLFFTLFG